MSYDGTEAFAVRLIEDEATIERAIRKIRRGLDEDEPRASKGTLLYTFGYGLSDPVGAETMAKILKPEWTKWPSKSSETIRYLDPGQARAASEGLEELRRSRRRLARRINECLLNAEDDLEESIKGLSPAAPADAETTGQRAAHAVWLAARLLEKARTRGCGILYYHRELGF